MCHLKSPNLNNWPKNIMNQSLKNHTISFLFLIQPGSLDICFSACSLFVAPPPFYPLLTVDAGSPRYPTHAGQVLHN